MDTIRKLVHLSLLSPSFWLYTEKMISHVKPADLGGHIIFIHVLGCLLKWLQLTLKWTEQCLH